MGLRGYRGSLTWNTQEPQQRHQRERAAHQHHANSRSRLNALYMTSIFIGGAFGSAIASSVYEHGGWLGVMLVGSAFPLVALLRFLSVPREAAPVAA